MNDVKGNRALRVVAATAVWILTMPLAVADAHGENDARLIVRGMEVGPYTVTLWNVLGDAASDLPAHIIVMAEGSTIPDESMVVVEGVDAVLPTVPSMTVDGAWETATGLAPGAALTLRITNGNGQWVTGDIQIPTVPEPNLLSQLIGSLAVFITSAAAYWLFRRTMRVWRRPIPIRAGT